MNDMKQYFLAGLAVEEARERRDAARERLREVAAVKCPDELAALDAASESFSEAEKRFVEHIDGMLEGARRQVSQAWMEEHARNCDNPNCHIRASLAKSAKSAKDAN